MNAGNRRGPGTEAAGTRREAKSIAATTAGRIAHQWDAAATFPAMR